MNGDALNPLGRLVPEQRVQDLEKLIQVVSQINRSLDPENVLTTSLTGVQSVLDADFGCFVFVDPDTGTIKLERCNGVPDSFRERLEQLALDFHPQTDFNKPEDRVNLVSQIGQRLSTVFEDEGISNSVLIPLLTQKQLIGVLLFGVAKQKLLSPKSVDLLMSIGEQVAMALENARLHARVKSSEEWHREFIENSLEPFWEGDAEGKILYVNNAACRLIGLERDKILQNRLRDFFVHDDQIRNAAALSLQEKNVWMNPRARLRTADGQIKIVSVTTIATRDSAGRIQRYQIILHDMTESEHLLESSRQRNEELAALNEIANILNKPFEIQSALDHVCEQIVSITDTEGIALYLLDAARHHLDLLAYKGMSDSLLPQVRRLGLNDPPTYLVAIEGKSLAFNDLTEPSLLNSFAGPRAEGFISGVCIPIEQRGLPIGAIYVGSKTKSEYVQSDIALMQNIGRQIGTALENANLFEQMSQRVQELMGLAKLSAACVSNLDVQSITEAAVKATIELLPVTFCSVRLLEGEEGRLVASSSAKNVPLPPTRTLQDFDFIRPAVTQQIPIMIEDVDQVSLSDEARASFLKTDTRAALVVPLPVQERTIGLLLVGCANPHEWKTHEVELVRTIANQVASAVNRAQLFQSIMTEQRKVQAIFDSGLSGLFATNAEGRIVMFNRAAERITGRALNEVIGFTWQEIFGEPAQDLPVEPLINEALVRKQTVFAQTGRSLRTRDGRIIPVAIAVAPLLDEKGNVTGAVGAFWDLSREQAAEMERDELVRMAAHQIRSPLTALLGALQIYERQNLAEEIRQEMWSIIMNQGERLRRFASQFLDWEASIKPARALNIEPLSIVSTIRSLAKEFRAQPGKRIIEIKSTKPEPMVLADLDNVEHILRNLIDNALNYSSRETPVHISIGILEDNRVEVRVRDHGSGIPPSEQEKIFQPFYRSPNAAGRSTYSHGLGLSIARGMAKEMDGNVWVESSEGKGSTFHLTLRRYR